MLQSCASINVEGNNSTQLEARLAKRQIRAVLAAYVLKRAFLIHWNTME